MYIYDIYIYMSTGGVCTSDLTGLCIGGLIGPFVYQIRWAVLTFM